ncbi:MAG TPA: hypothetical protein VGY58_16705 [Gemmataceae bacterium]|jgi:hypothetical protein|nr:hypothetical protein [Gemmataceae bacterium]
MPQKLACPFLDESPTFAYGVEFGLLFARMRREKVIADYFLRRNQDQILLAASRLGWQVLRMKPQGDWLWIKMKRRLRRHDHDAGG